MGTYGFLRFALPFFPAVALSDTVQLVIVILSLISIIYGGLVAMVQPDFKKLIAYSSVAHLRSEEHTSELQSRLHLGCRLLLEKKKKQQYIVTRCSTICVRANTATAAYRHTGAQCTS